MTEKIVYDPKEDAKNQKKAAKSTKNPKDGADVESDEPVTQFKAKVNKYGFLRVPKHAWTSLPFEMEKPLIARIDGENLVIAAVTEKSA
jgi:hypothetical protein